MWNKRQNGAPAPDRQRRRLLGGLAGLTLAGGLFSRRALAAPAPRVAVLEWTGVEILHAQGIAPIAVADTRGYHSWVGEPALPPDCIDLGLRGEPNLELLSTLSPSLIVIGETAGFPPSRLNGIAPLWQYPFLRPDKPLLAVARENVLSLAEKTHTRQQAQNFLLAAERQLAHFRQTMAPLAGKRVLLITLLNPRQVLVLGDNSLFGEVLREAGMTSAWPGATSAWGSTIVGIEQLIYCRPDITLHFSYDNASSLLAKLSTSPIWRQMPLHRQGHMYTLPPMWLYGGLHAALTFARHFSSTVRGAA